MGSEIRPHASLGVSVFPNDAQDRDALVRAADTAMYAAKEGGRNRLAFYAPEMTERSGYGGRGRDGGPAQSPERAWMRRCSGLSVWQADAGRRNATPDAAGRERPRHSIRSGFMTRGGVAVNGIVVSKRRRGCRSGAGSRLGSGWQMMLRLQDQRTAYSIVILPMKAAPELLGQDMHQPQP